MLTPKTILVVKNRALGDAVIGLSGLKYLRQEFPLAKITYAVPSWMMQLFRDSDLIDDVIALDLKNLYGWTKTYQGLLGKNFDLIIEFNQSGRSGNFFKLFSLINSIPYFFHNHNLRQGQFVIDQGVRKPNTQKDLDLIFSVLRHYGIPKEIPKYENFPLEFSRVTAEKKNQIIFGMVATRETKLWPIEYFYQLAQMIYAKEPQIKILIPLSNNSLDQKIKSIIRSFGFPPNCQIIEAPLTDLRRLIAGSLLYIGNDTGIKHLCVSLNVPTISFFGPEEPYEWHPYDKKRHPYFFIEPLECRTRVAHFCGLEKCEVMACMRPITPETVLTKVSEFIPLS